MTAVLRCLCPDCRGIVYLRCRDYFDAHPDLPLVVEYRNEPRLISSCVLSPRP